MSLFIGNLSAHARKEELEHEFGRFGRSYVKLKDGYGFVVYEYHEDAERALRALRGQDVCGENISLTWSNKQPRGNRYSEEYIGPSIRRGNNMSRRGNNMSRRGINIPMRGYNMSRRGNDFSRNRGFYNRVNFVRRPFHNQRASPMNESEQKADDVIEKTGDLMSEKGKRSDGFPTVNLPEHMNSIANGQQGGSIPCMMAENGRQDDAMFERYEPKYDFDGADIEEKHKESASPTHSKSLDKGMREQSVDVDVNHSKPKPVCYNCGLLGHTMHRCPRESSIRLEKFGNFFSRKDDIIGSNSREEHSRLKRRPWRRTYTTREISFRDHLDYGNRHSQSGKRKWPIEKKSSKKYNDMDHVKPMMDDIDSKRRKHDDSSPSKRLKKRMQRSNSSYSFGSSSRSLSQPSRSLSGCSPRSRSLSGRSPRSRSLSGRSRSKSSRSFSRTSRTRSSSKSSKRRTDIHRLRSRSVSSISKSLSSLSDTKTTPSKNDAINPRNSPVPISTQEHVSNHTGANTELEVPGSEGAMEAEILDTSLIAGCSIPKEDMQGYYMTSQFSLDTEGIKKDTKFAALDNNSSFAEKLQESLKEKADIECSVPPKSRVVIATGSDRHNCKPTRISPQEIHVALKHYGLEEPEICKRGLPESVESFFGAARLWPWQIVYYRRLRKGPISTENYTRRLAQNKEFGIIDKYVRSSSGWDEF